jgi:hypothetical protein
VPQGVDLRIIGAFLVSLQELLNTGKHHLRNRLPILVVHEAVEQFAERGFDRCVLWADHATANHLRPERVCMDRSH